MQLQGKKGALDPGEVLYNANEVEPHLALELTERLIRLSLESTSADDTNGDEETEIDENGADTDCHSWVQSIAAAGRWMLRKPFCPHQWVDQSPTMFLGLSLPTYRSGDSEEEN